MDKVFDIFAYLMGKQAGGGGGDITVVSKSISSNGTYTAPSGKAYSPVTVNVPNSYAAGDEGKVVSNGALVAQTAHAEVTANGTIDTTLNNSVVVNLPGPAWTEFIVASAATNIASVFNIMFAGAQTNRLFTAVLEKSVENYANNQAVQIAVYNKDGTAVNARIVYMRYKNATYDAVSGHTTQFDAAIEVGDKYYISEV